MESGEACLASGTRPELPEHCATQHRTAVSNSAIVTAQAFTEAHFTRSASMAWELIEDGGGADHWLICVVSALAILFVADQCIRTRVVQGRWFTLHGMVLS